ncbi:DUF4102 domain-containing protein, partial [Phenylobacterium sp. CCH12-B4]|uniref:DUF4102 domain-containing protein n=1 Tax=Phenylobacterium sp. CCH12-B4 TaxID=1768784 RepID=UPI000AA73A81
MTKATVTDREVRAFKPHVNATGVLVRRLAVGGGLFFEITAAGHRHFIHRFQWQGKGAERAIPGTYLSNGVQKGPPIGVEEGPP